MGIAGSLKHYLRDSRYCIGFIEDYRFLGLFEHKKIHWLDLNGYSDGWFADPFILSADGESMVVLAEEWFYPINHGRISRLLISRNGFRLLDVKPVLQLETHLSFPYYVKDSDKVYICPENQESGSVLIYEYDGANYRLTNPVKLIDKPLMDVQIVCENGTYYLMGVKYLTGEQEDTRNMEVYTAPCLFGPYAHLQTIRSQNCDKRGAGLIFRSNGMLIRPSQCCDNNEYGTAVIFNELRIGHDFVAECEVGRISRRKKMRNGLVLHTFNRIGDVTAIDGWDYKHKVIGRFVELLRKKIRKYIHN